MSQYSKVGLSQDRSFKGGREGAIKRVAEVISLLYWFIDLHHIFFLLNKPPTDQVETKAFRVGEFKNAGIFSNLTKIFEFLQAVTLNLKFRWREAGTPDFFFGWGKKTAHFMGHTHPP